MKLKPNQSVAGRLKALEDKLDTISFQTERLAEGSNPDVVEAIADTLAALEIRSDEGAAASQRRLDDLEVSVPRRRRRRRARG